MNKADINIVIRTFNEEDWIYHTLTKVMSQDYPSFHVSVVDSGSTDSTLAIVDSFRKKQPENISIITVEKFIPGDAINRGAAAIESEFFVCLSAHCLPVEEDWLSKYVKFMRSHPEVAGVYGRQLPMSCTHPDDARDLMITFGPEERFNTLDPFFHNANSMIRRKVWLDEPFDSIAPHIEDRIWAKKVLQDDWLIAYLPTASVYHYHGIHQHSKNKSFRAQNVYRVMSELDDEADSAASAVAVLRDSLRIPMIVLVPVDMNDHHEVRQRIEILMKKLPDYQCYVICHFAPQVSETNFKFIDRARVDRPRSSLRQLLRNALSEIETDIGETVDGLIIFDLMYKTLFSDMASKCVHILIEQWISAVLPAWRDFGNYWIEDDGVYTNVSSSYRSRYDKKAFFRTVLGQGAAIRASLIRSEKENIEAGEVVWTEDSRILERHLYDSR